MSGDNEKDPRPGDERREQDERGGEEPGRSESEKDSDLGGVGQEGTSEPQPGIAEHQGGGIEGAIGGGSSGQGGG